MGDLSSFYPISAENIGQSNKTNNAMWAKVHSGNTIISDKVKHLISNGLL